MKQKSNFTFLLSYAKNEKYKLYFSAFLSVCSSIRIVVPYILIYNIILELLKTDLDYNRVKKLAIYTAILIILRLVLFISIYFLKECAVKLKALKTFIPFIY